MSQLGKRLFSSAGLITISLLTIFLAPFPVFFLVIEALILIALVEYFAMVEKKGITVFKWPGLAVGALIPFFVVQGSVSMVFVLAALLLFIIYFRPSLKKQSIVSISVTVFGFLFISWFISHFLLLRRLDHGAWWVFYAVLLVKGGDAGAYFAGKNYGKTKLIEHVSPNKSVEGAVAGIITSFVLSIVSAIYLPVSVGHLAVLGILIGAVAQIGDLGESLLKRDADIKDSGVIPGLGGILDVLDSLTLTVPFLYYYITAVVAG